MSHHDKDVDIHYRVWCLCYIKQGGYGFAPHLQNKSNQQLVRSYLAGEHGHPDKYVARQARLALDTIQAEGSQL